MTKQNHPKLIFSVTAVFLVMLMCSYFYLYYTYKTQDVVLHRVKPFYFKDSKQLPLTVYDFKKSISIVWLVGDSLDEKQFSSFSSDLQDSLENRFELHDKTVVKVFVFSKKYMNSKNWRQFQSFEDTEEAFGFQNQVLIVDNELQVRGVFKPITKNIKNIENLLSKLMFGKSLTEYLTNRTFFGAKRFVKG